MRSRAFRRHQEEKHYKRRLHTQIALGRFVEGVDAKGNHTYIPNYTQKTQINMLNAERLYHCGAYSEQVRAEAEQLRAKRWKYLLKHTSMPCSWERYWSRMYRRTLRHFQKMVDYVVPRNRYLVRASIMKGAPIEIDDPYELWKPFPIENTKNWWEDRE